MSKVVRWRGKFADINNKQYAVDIYGEGDAQTAVKEIVLGENPLTTEEDDNDDLFTPVRTQTGTLEVLDPDGTLMEEMLPADNLDHPVRVYEVATGKVVWQGFLSCEAYSQDYTARAQVVELNLLGVLEAMRSVTIVDNDTIAFNNLLAHIANALNRFVSVADVVEIEWVKFGERYRSMLTTANLYSSIFFDSQCVDNEGREVHTLVGVSCYDVLEMVARSIGCTVREDGKSIYMLDGIDAGEIASVRYADLINYVFGGGSLHVITSQAPTMAMSDMAWMGTNHEITYCGGAKRVEVTADFEDDFENAMSAPTVPDLPTRENASSRQENWGKVLATTERDFNNLVTFNSVTARMTEEVLTQGYQYRLNLAFRSIAHSNNYAQTLHYADNAFYDNYFDIVYNRTKSVTGVNIVATSYMATITDENRSLDSAEGVMLYGFPTRLGTNASPMMLYSPFAVTEDKYIFSMKSEKMVDIHSGRLLMSGRCNWLYGPDPTKRFTPNSISEPVKIVVALTVGGKYYNAGEWQDEFCTFPVSFYKGGEIDDQLAEDEKHLSLPIKSPAHGQMELRIYPYIDGLMEDGTWPVIGLGISQLDIEEDVSSEAAHRTKKVTYGEDTGARFTDTVSVDMDFVSSFNNRFSRKMYFADPTTPKTHFYFGELYSRPEKDLLRRMLLHYSRRHAMVQLCIANSGTMANTIVQGYDGREYISAGGSVDWRLATSNMTFVEK